MGDTDKLVAQATVEDGGSFAMREASKVESTVISFKDISMTLKQKKKPLKQILDNVSGYCAPGKLMALMGPSGSGKTSLLNVLAGRTKKISGLKVSGSISANGADVTNWSNYRRLCAYVEQDDLLFHTL